jgi:putative copper resistance protein D
MSWLATVRGVHLAASVLLAGAIAFELLVLRRATDGVQDTRISGQALRWLRTLGGFGLALGLASWAAWLAAVAIGMTGLPVAEALAPDTLTTVVTRTTFGQVWLLRSVLLVLLALPLLSWRAAATRPANWLVIGSAAMAALLMGSLAWAGHAVASHRAHPWVDAAHLCAAAVWLGMLPPLWLLVQRASATGDPGWQRLAGRAARLFSAPGIAAVLVLAITGGLNGWWLVGSVDKLLGSSYGLLLVAKLALFAGMLGLAARNRMVLTPRIDQPEPLAPGGRLALRRLRRNVVAEMVLGAAVLGLVGRLGVTPPAVHEQGPRHRHEQPTGDEHEQPARPNPAPVPHHGHDG